MNWYRQCFVAPKSDFTCSTNLTVAFTHTASGDALVANVPTLSLVTSTMSPTAYAAKASKEPLPGVDAGLLPKRPLPGVGVGPLLDASRALPKSPPVLRRVWK